MKSCHHLHEKKDTNNIILLQSPQKYEVKSKYLLDNALHQKRVFVVTGNFYLNISINKIYKQISNKIDDSRKQYLDLMTKKFPIINL